MICIFVKYKYVKAENNMEYGNPSNYLLYDGLNTIYYKNEIRTINQKYENSKNVFENN